MNLVIQQKRLTSPESRRVTGASRALLGLSAAALSCSLACSPSPSGSNGSSAGEPSEPTDPVAALSGRIFTSEPMVVVLGRNWASEEATARVGFMRFATLTWRVDLPPGASVTVGLAPSDPLSEGRLEVSWDGQPLTTLAWSTDDPLEITVPAASLTAGTHSLRLAAPDDAPKGPYAFSSVWYSLDGENRELSQRPLVHSFLAYGVTGARPYKMGGFLFHGPRRLAGHLPAAPGERVLTGVAENDSPATATFTITVDGRDYQRTLESTEQLPFELPVPAAAAEVEFAVTGSPDGFFLWGAPHLRPAAEDDRPSVVLITMDTTRRDALSPYGEDPQVTPEIHAFSASATVFERAVSTTSWTLPSHASIFTGLYGSRHHAGFPSDHLDLSFSTLAELLRDAGYATAGSVGGVLTGAQFGVAQGFDRYRWPSGGQRAGRELTADALAFLESDGERPFFLFLNYFEPHLPYRPAPEQRERLGVDQLAAGIADSSTWQRVVHDEQTGWNLLNTGRMPADEAGHRFLRALYLAEVATMDAEIGRVLDALEAHGVAERCLVILVADHGEFLGEHNLYSHSHRLDPELVDVPLLIRWPGQREPRRVAELVSIIDLFPTVLEAAGVPVPAGHGLSLDPAARDGIRARRQVLLEEHSSPIHRLFPHMKIADDLWGIDRSTDRRVGWQGGSMCWDRSTGGWRRQPCLDPWQLIVDEATAVLGPVVAPGEEGVVDDSEIERLKALGYL